eukprot:CAMPEP_0182426086 /NCGR_PEP_ID=MMETSP1167-20130531/12568_1 /TAXON_ID=2988 /ORGANISM="Mallomonas Sp, Strain CCMP3275" /LENGTH=386 /DNA_ID=CAMNT_0024607277 /DNA_START=335 /DNA_END=1495 /DNA_ORIENTATION=-
MKFIWTIQGRFTSFAVASNDYYTVASESSPTYLDESVGWIGVSGSLKHHIDMDSAQTDNDKSEEEEEEEEEEEMNNDKNLVNETIYLFNYSSSKPVITQKLSTNIISMMFWTRVEEKKIGSGRLLSILKNGELHTICPIIGTEDASEVIPGTVVAKLSKSEVSEVAVIAAAHMNTTDITDETDKSLLSVHANKPKLHPNWTQSLFDEDSENIPSVSSLYDSFVGNLLKRKRDENEESISYTVDRHGSSVSSSAPATSDQISSEVTPTSSRTEVAVERVEESQLEASDDRKLLFQTGLSSFFSDYLTQTNENTITDSSTTTTTTVTTTNTSKLSTNNTPIKTPKKHDKRDKQTEESMNITPSTLTKGTTSSSTKKSNKKSKKKKVEE